MELRFGEGAGTRFATDVCIVGSGPTGLVLAAELARSGLEVLVVESGLPGDDAAAADLGAGENHGAMDVDLLASRRRTFGGTGTAWGGQCLRLDATVLADRPWLGQPGWPVAPGELDRHYARAEALMGIEAPSYGPEVLRARRLRPLPLDATRLEQRFSIVPRRVDVGALLRARLARHPRTRVLHGATAVGLTPDGAGGGVGGVELAAVGGARGGVTARSTVLCAGGIENARLLLVRERGLDPALPRSPLLGRCFQDHPNGVAADVAVADPRRLQSHFGMLFGRGRRYWPRLVLSAEAQERHATPQAAATFTFAHPPTSGVEVARRVVRAGRRGAGLAALRAERRALVRAAADLPEVAWRRGARGLSSARPAASTALHVYVEQLPHPERRVELAPSAVDALGVPRPVVRWDSDEEERRTAALLVGLVDGELQRLGLGRAVARPWLDELDGLRAHFTDQYHHMGTTRMGADPRTSVVDAQGAVHGARGLYACGTSTFPTSGTANPTLTAMALAARLAEHLRQP